MILIADSSALIALAIVDKLDILDKLFGEVYLPRAVYDEVSREHKPESSKLVTYCKTRIVEVTSAARFNVTLGKGESEAIVLYQEKQADFLLCDDKKAKKFAVNFGVRVVGSLGVLLKAKESHLVEEIAPLIAILNRSSVFIDQKTCNLVLEMAGE